MEKEFKFYKVMRVNTKSDPAKVAGALANHILEVLRFRPHTTEFCELSCIGPIPNNQAIKAVAIANGMLAPKGIELVIKPAFADVIIDNEEKSAFRQIIRRI